MGITRPKRRADGASLVAGAGVLAAFLLAAPAAVTAAPAGAAESGPPPRLGLPIDCQPGKDCWLVNLVDVDPGPGVRDYACGKRTYDGHKGVDIAIRDLAAMEEGVQVLAAAAGRVKNVRDGMPDIDVTIAGRESVKGRECGNGVVITHGGGWETQYCHLRQGSIAVNGGDTVARGRKLGLAGNSGFAQFPHVHLSVRLGKRIVDPFQGPPAAARQKACGLGRDPLWRKDALARLGGGTTALYHAGFATAAPDPASARDGRLNARLLSRRVPALVFWVDIFWVEAGDRLKVRLTGPDGTSIREHSLLIKKTQARFFAFAGKKRKTRRWPAGTYRGEVTLLGGPGRKGKRTFTLVREVELR